MELVHQEGDEDEEGQEYLGHMVDEDGGEAGRGRARLSGDRTVNKAGGLRKVRSEGGLRTKTGETMFLHSKDTFDPLVTSLIS